MQVADWMILAAAMLPYVMTVAAKSGGGIDNAHPRAGLEMLRGWRQRADWTQRNHFEAFPAFAAGVIVAELVHARQGAVDRLAGLFVLFRIAYSIAYVAGRPGLRSICWFGGLICVIALFCAGA